MTCYNIMRSKKSNIMNTVDVSITNLFKLYFVQV